MATWIVHLRVANNLLDMIDGLHTGQFLIGNLGPDLNIQAEDWESFTPHGDVTHFRNSIENKYWSSDLEFYNQYLSDHELSVNDPQRFSFLLGYFFHLITDNLWHLEVGSPTEKRYAEQFAADPDFIWEVKRDWYGLDFIYLRDHPDAGFWIPFINADYNQDYLDFFPQETIQEKLTYIKSFYQRQDEKINVLIERDFIYLSEETMNAFIVNSSTRIHQIINYLWRNHDELDKYNSALDLPIEIL
jgi:hypothetical protein